MPATPTKRDESLTQGTLIEALSFVLKEVGAERAPGLTADQLDDLLQRQDRRNNRSNPDYPGISPFSYPEGNRARPKPTLVRPFFLNFAPIREDQTTPYEILALNALSDALPAADQERKARGGAWQARTSSRGDKVLITIPMNTTDARNEAMGTSIGLICEELINGGPALTAQTMHERVAALEAEITSLRAGKIPALTTA